MQPLQIIDLFFGDDFNPPADACPVEIIYRGNQLPHDVATITYYAAVADMSGWLDDATTPGEALEAIDHGKSLHSAGVLSDEQVHERVREIIAEAERQAPYIEARAKAAGMGWSVVSPD